MLAVENHIVAILKYIAIVDHAKLWFWYYVLMLLQNLQLKFQKFIIYSYNIQTIHILVCWNPLEMEIRSIKYFFYFDNSN